LREPNGRTIFWTVTKGEDTRRTILDRAVRLSRKVGFEGLSIGLLAEDLQLSKSGLFAHFGSKEALQLAVIDHARQQFVTDVMVPALKAKRGEPRVRALVDRWFVWGKDEGGCLFIALAAELDDRPGPARDALAATQRDWLDSLATATQMAIDEKHFRADVDPQQVAFELYGIMLAQHNIGRLLEDPKVGTRSRHAVTALIARCRRD
jgi:AcrR family transcriptional regulator